MFLPCLPPYHPPSIPLFLCPSIRPSVCPSLSLSLNRQQLDPRGLFLNDWARRVFNLSSQPVQQFGDHCALRGICYCRQDSHCNPQAGSFCRSGLVYADAKVCRLENAE